MFTTARNHINTRHTAKTILAALLLSAALGMLFTAKAASYEGVNVINFADTGMGVNVQYAPKSGIGNIVLDSTSNREKNELWQFTYNAAYDAYYITPLYRPGGALNALYGKDAQAGSQARLHDSNTNDTASLWKIEKYGSYLRFKNVACNYYLDVAHGKTSAGTRLNIWHNDTSTVNQCFKLVNISKKTNLSWDYPMNNTICSWRSSTNMSWGNRNGSGARSYHVGLDLKSSTGDGTVKAAADGVVVYRNYTNGNGNHVVIEHTLSDGTKIKSLYSHLDSFKGCPAVNQTVRKGQQIGVYGTTGNCTSKTNPHLHFAIYRGSSNDPYGYATAFSGNKVTYKGITFYNPSYVISKGMLP